MNSQVARCFVFVAALAGGSICAIAADGTSYPVDALQETVGSWIYRDGVFHWPGDWTKEFAKLNYHDTDGDPGTEDLSVRVNLPWGYWLPYCPQVGPDINGYKVPSCDLTPYSGITLQLKATIANQKWSMTIFKYNIVGGKLIDDTVVGGVNDLTPYGGPAEVGQFVTYTVPLSDMHASGLKTMYKFMLQDETGKSGQTWYVNKVAFVK